MSEKLKRFDDIYRMMLLIITISVSIGSLTFDALNLSNTLIFILLSLFFWMIGHVIGANQNGRQYEAFFKLMAWLYVSFVAIIMFSKACFQIPIIEGDAVLWCSTGALIVTFFATIFIYDMLPSRRKSTYVVYILTTFSSLILNLPDLSF